MGEKEPSTLWTLMSVDTASCLSPLARAPGLCTPGDKVHLHPAGPALLDEP